MKAGSFTNTTRRHDEEAAAAAAASSSAAEREEASGGGGGVVNAVLRLELVPLLDGAEECVRKKVFSSLHPQNLRLRRAVSLPDESLALRPAFSLLFDPQTSGGLLVSLPAAQAAEFVAALQEAGYADTAVIGEVVSPLASHDPESPLCVSIC
mmetsp:Transcript_39487/g.72772  ORF Transcript_39487/g.72772 Transcript_39487/m.72772 type:complete len:153 (+) Transcript_39487:150-608(+)